jgi:hypothetical protein
MMASNAASPYRELAYRASDGIEIQLLWQQGTDELLVSVSDERSGAYFELAAGPDQALDVFNHPYAHAAFRGLPYEVASLPCWAEVGDADGRIGPDLSKKRTR